MSKGEAYWDGRGVGRSVLTGKELLNASLR